MTSYVLMLSYDIEQFEITVKSMAINVFICNRGIRIIIRIIKLLSFILLMSIFAAELLVLLKQNKMGCEFYVR